MPSKTTCRCFVFELLFPETKTANPAPENILVPGFEESFSNRIPIFRGVSTCRSVRFQGPGSTPSTWLQDPINLHERCMLVIHRAQDSSSQK